MKLWEFWFLDLFISGESQLIWNFRSRTNGRPVPVWPGPGPPVTRCTCGRRPLWPPASASNKQYLEEQRGKAVGGLDIVLRSFLAAASQRESICCQRSRFRTVVELGQWYKLSFASAYRVFQLPSYQFHTFAFVCAVNVAVKFRSPLCP